MALSLNISRRDFLKGAGAGAAATGMGSLGEQALALKKGVDSAADDAEILALRREIGKEPFQLKKIFHRGFAIGDIPNDSEGDNYRAFLAQVPTISEMRKFFSNDRLPSKFPESSTLTDEQLESLQIFFMHKLIEVYALADTWGFNRFGITWYEDRLKIGEPDLAKDDIFPYWRFVDRATDYTLDLILCMLVPNVAFDNITLLNAHVDFLKEIIYANDQLTFSNQEPEVRVYKAADSRFPFANQFLLIYDEQYDPIWNDAAVPQELIPETIDPKEVIKLFIHKLTTFSLEATRSELKNTLDRDWDEMQLIEMVESVGEVTSLEEFTLKFEPFFNKKVLEVVLVDCISHRAENMSEYQNLIRIIQDDNMRTNIINVDSLEELLRSATVDSYDRGDLQRVFEFVKFLQRDLIKILYLSTRTSFTTEQESHQILFSKLFNLGVMSANLGASMPRWLGELQQGAEISDSEADNVGFLIVKFMTSLFLSCIQNVRFEDSEVLSLESVAEAVMQKLDYDVNFDFTSKEAFRRNPEVILRFLRILGPHVGLVKKFTLEVPGSSTMGWDENMNLSFAGGALNVIPTARHEIAHTLDRERVFERVLENRNVLPSSILRREYLLAVICRNLRLGDEIAFEEAFGGVGESYDNELALARRDMEIMLHGEDVNRTVGSLSPEEQVSVLNWCLTNRKLIMDGKSAVRHTPQQLELINRACMSHYANIRHSSLGSFQYANTDLGLTYSITPAYFEMVDIGSSGLFRKYQLLTSILDYMLVNSHLSILTVADIEYIETERNIDNIIGFLKQKLLEISGKRFLPSMMEDFGLLISLTTLVSDALAAEKDLSAEEKAAYPYVIKRLSDVNSSKAIYYEFYQLRKLNLSNDELKVYLRELIEVISRQRIDPFSLLIDILSILPDNWHPPAGWFEEEGFRDFLNLLRDLALDI